MRRLFLILILLSSWTPGTACSCYYTAHFCDYAAQYFEWTEGRSVVARATFNDYKNGDRSGQGFFPLYDFTLTGVYAGDARAGDRISLLGQDGGNCNGWLNEPRAGEEFIILYANRPDTFMSYYSQVEVDNPYPIFDMPGCGPSALPLRNGMVSGDIAAGVVRMDLPSFIARLYQDCLSEYVPAGGTPSGPDLLRVNATVSPNPTRLAVQVQFAEAASIYAVGLYDMLGRRIYYEDLRGEVIREYRIPVAGLAAGVYVLVMDTDGVRVKEQVVVY